MRRTSSISLLSALLVLAASPLLAPSAALAVEDAAPTLGAATVTAPSPTVVSVSIPVDTHGNETTLTLEYGPTTAYGASGALSTVPASSNGPTTVTGTVVGVQPETTYHAQVKAQNARGQATTADLTFTTPAVPVVSATTTYKAKVSDDGTALKALTVSGLKGGESIRVTCATKQKGCLFTKENYKKVKSGSLELAKLFKGKLLEAGAKVTVVVTAPGAVPAKLTLLFKNGKKPKATRG